MSSTLFKKSLEIVEDNHNPKYRGKLQKRDMKRTATAFDLIPHNHRLVKTIKQKGQKKKINEISETKKVTVDEIRKQLSTQGNRAEENLSKLLKLSAFNKIEDKTIEKIARRAKAGHYIVPIVEAPVEEKSIFTEEDFANLEKELFFDD